MLKGKVATLCAIMMSRFVLCPVILGTGEQSASDSTSAAAGL